MSMNCALLGLGRRGETLAQLCLDAGWDVRAFDPAISAAAAEARLDGVKRADTISSAVRGADWVFCCLPDRIELIQTVMRRAQSEAPNGAVLAVLSALYDIEALQSCTVRPSHVLRLSLDETGACVLDVTERNSDDVRAHAKRVASHLAAVGSLGDSHDKPAHDARSESA